MDKLKEVIVYSDGDSNALSTWSNVPYFFTKTLEEKGIKVHRVNIQPLNFPERIYDRTIWKVMNKFQKNYFNLYLRTYAHHLYVKNVIRKSELKFNNADAHIFLTFSHTAKGISKKPTVMFCDWTIDYYFKSFLNRRPNFLEKFPLQRQNKAIESADLVISLFPGVTNHMKEYHKHSRIIYLGNVVNSQLQASSQEILAKKINSRELLFIGSKKYIEGAKELINAHTVLKEKYPGLKVNIIGMNPELFENLPEDVVCYGYLDKANDKQRELYYSLLQQAKAIVNTTPKWGAFSSTIEAMYFYCPVITTPYSEFVETFGREINFGFYCEPGQLLSALEKLLIEKEYEHQCLNAHDAVKDFSWDAYIGKVIAEIEKI